MSVEYKKIEHWIPLQKESEEKMLAEFESGNYTVENPLVKTNVYLINPLSAVVCFKTEEETAVTIRVRGKTKAADIVHTFPKAKTHVLPVLGLYANYNNTVEITPYRGNTTTIHIEIGDVCDHSVVEYIQTTPEYFEDNIMFLTPAGSEKSIGVDFAGDIRWHLTALCVFDVKRLRNGNLLIGTDRLIKLPYYMSGLYEMSPVGKIYKEFRVPGGYHHDQFEMPDGNLLCLTEDLTSDTVEDMCILLDRNTGEILKTWDYKKFLTPGEGKGLSYTDEDWFHNNAVWYDANTNSLTFSGRHIDSMVNIDFDSGELNWIIGDPETWPEHMQKYFFKPVGNNFEWQYEQHANLITPNGDVMCFDNHHNSTKVEEKKVPAYNNFSRGVRYKINTKDMTIEQVWQYGKERGQEFYSQYICNVEYYKEGHYMVHSGGIQYYGDDASEQFAALMQDDPMVRTRSITVEVLDDEVMLELEVKGNFYRAEKLSLYHNQDNLPLGEGKRLGHMGVTKESDTLIPMDCCGEELSHIYEASIEEEDNRFNFKATFESGQLVMLMLEQGEEQHGYFISTAKTPFAALCCGTFIEKDARKVTCSVNKAGLSGTYKVRVIVDDKKYETGIEITC